MPFQRLVREIAIELAKNGAASNIRFESQGLMALQEAAEAYVVDLLKTLTFVRYTQSV